MVLAMVITMEKASCWTTAQEVKVVLDLQSGVGGWKVLIQLDVERKKCVSDRESSQWRLMNETFPRSGRRTAHASSILWVSSQLALHTRHDPRSSGRQRHVLGLIDQS